MEDLEPELVDAVEAEAVAGRKEVASLEGLKPIVALIANEQAPAPVLAGAGSALFNLVLDPANAASLSSLGVLPRLHELVKHADAEVAGAIAHTCILLVVLVEGAPAEEAEKVDLLRVCHEFVSRGRGQAEGPTRGPVRMRCCPWSKGCWSGNFYIFRKLLS